MSEELKKDGEIGFGKCSTCGAQNYACGCPLLIQHSMPEEHDKYEIGEQKELKKEWEREFDEKFKTFTFKGKSEPSLFAQTVVYEDVKSFISFLLARQQEEFVKRIEDEAVKVCKGDDDCIDTFSEIFADIKSKLK
jgi:hypothetical protein